MVNFSSKIIYFVDYKVFKHFQIVKVYTLNLITVLNIYVMLVAEMYKTYVFYLTTCYLYSLLCIYLTEKVQIVLK